MPVHQAAALNWCLIHILVNATGLSNCPEQIESSLALEERFASELGCELPTGFLDKKMLLIGQTELLEICKYPSVEAKNALMHMPVLIETDRCTANALLKKNCTYFCTIIAIMDFGIRNMPIMEWPGESRSSLRARGMPKAMPVADAGLELYHTTSQLPVYSIYRNLG